MKLIVTKENLKKVLGLVGHVISNTATLPVLGNILLQTEKGRIKISATNLELGLTAWLGGKIEEEGSVTIPARTFNEYISTTLGEQITLQNNKNSLQVLTESSEASFKTLPPEEFPLIPRLEPNGQITLPATELKNALGEVVFAAASLETQPELAGVYISRDETKIYLVATDRYRLSERVIELSKASIEGDFKPVLIPLKTAQEAVRILSTTNGDARVSIIQGDNQVLFKLPDLELISRLVDGQFPDYKQIIPTQFKSEAQIPRFEFMQAVKSASLFAANSRSIRLGFKPASGQLEVAAASGDIGESVVRLAGIVSGIEQENTFNYKYLLDYLGSITDGDIVFKTVNDSSPAVIAPKDRGNSRYMVMPIKS